MKSCLAKQVKLFFVLKKKTSTVKQQVFCVHIRWH